MIPEYNMRSAVPLNRLADGSERVTGYLTIMWGQLHIVDPKDENTAITIAPDTIEPVRVKLIHLLREIADAMGYEVRGRVWLKDKESGEEYR